jgi:tetratricopeptide (TPR) repeat protein
MPSKRLSIYTWGLVVAVAGALVLAWGVWPRGAHLGSESSPTSTAPTPLPTGRPLVLVANFQDRSEDQHTGSLPEEDIYQALLDRVRVDGLDLHVERLNETADEFGAAYLGRTNDATLVVWGWYDGARIQAHVEQIETPTGRSSTFAFCALDEPPTQVPYLVSFVLSVQMYAQGDHERALECLDAATSPVAAESVLDCAAIHTQRGLVLQALGDYTAALTAFSRAIEMQPDNAELYINRGQVFALMEEYNAAHADFERAWELEQDIPSWFN